MEKPRLVAKGRAFRGVCGRIARSRAAPFAYSKVEWIVALLASSPSDLAPLRSRTAAVSSSTYAHESGGLSGAPLPHLSLATVERIHRRYGSNLPLISVGGIIAPNTLTTSSSRVASLIQLCTGLIYEGPGLVPRINRYIRDRLQADGFRSLSEAIGAATL
jgi:Dihydroorotate dehydrogenase